MANEAAWDELVSDLYRSAVDVGAAGRVPGRFAALTGGVVASAWRINTSDLSMVGEPMTNLPPEAVEAYRRHYFRYDPWAGAVHQARFDEVLTRGTIISDEELFASVYYNEFAVTYEMFHLTGAVVPLGGRRAGVVSILQPRGAGAFEEPAIIAFGRALPHIKSAFQLAEQVDASQAAVRQAALDGVLEALDVAAVILDGAGRVLRVNRLAEGIEAVRRGLTRRANPHGVFQAGHSAEQRQFATMVAGVARGAAGGQFRLTDGTCSYLATVTPLPAELATETERRKGRVLLLLRPLAPRRGADVKLLTALFGMTPAEGAAAIALVKGATPQEIATAREVKVSTVRTLLQRAQDKAGCRNLRELVGVLAGLG